MPQYYTSAKTGGEDDGRSLLASDLYRLEIQEIDRLDLAQEQELVELARTGNEAARAQIVESCLGYVYSMAWHYSRLHPSNSEPLDLSQVGNEAVVRHLDESLRSRYTCAFLRLVARRAMIDYCMEDKLIRVPARSYNRGRRAPLTVSLTAPLYGDSDMTVLDLLEDANWQELDACLEVAS
jgi:DNA-directed RNA polymerase sigma subunit (sigma70/sigma32)